MNQVDNAVLQESAKTVEWFLYLIRCRGGFLYTGISTDVERRFHEHAIGKGSKYLRGKGPMKLVFQTKIGTHSMALKAEAAIKKYPKNDKEELIQTGLPENLRRMLNQLM